MKNIRTSFSAFLFSACLLFSHGAAAQTGSLVSGNIPQDQSRVTQDITQLQDDERAGNVHAVGQDVAFLNVQQQILATDENSIKSFSNISQQFENTSQNFNHGNNESSQTPRNYNNSYASSNSYSSSSSASYGGSSQARSYSSSSSYSAATSSQGNRQYAGGNNMTHSYNGQNMPSSYGGNMRTVGYINHNNGYGNNGYHPGNGRMTSQHSPMGFFGPAGGGKAGVASAVSISRGSMTKGMSAPHHH
jgi:hypothetical protein